MKLRPFLHILKHGAPLGYIYMLHRICEQSSNKLFANENMNVSPILLEQFIEYLKNKNIDIISLSDVPKHLCSKNKKMFVAFSMDDGYKDNLTNALPVFKRQNTPYTIFLSGSFPEKSAILWWYEIEDLILNNEIIELGNGHIYECYTKKQKESSFIAIREEILKLNQQDLVHELNTLFSKYKVSWTSKCSQLCLSWEDVKTISKEPLVTIGAHTAHHYNLKQLIDEDSVKTEIMEGMRLYKEKADIIPNIFAYPFGSPNEVGDREIKVLSKLPFKLSVLAYGGEVTKRNSKNLYSLPRIFLTEDYIKQQMTR